jgi:hypothetical protein
MIKVGLVTAIIACYWLNCSVILPKDRKLTRIITLIDDGKVNVLLKTPWEVVWVFVDSVIFVQSEWSADIEKTFKAEKVG